MIWAALYFTVVLIAAIVVGVVRWRTEYHWIDQLWAFTFGAGLTFLAGLAVALIALLLVSLWVAALGGAA